MLFIKMLSGAAIVSLLIISFKYIPRQRDTFVSFDIQLNGAGAITIQWTTASKVKNVRFEIERSRNQRVWNKITVVTGQLESTYTFTDNHPEKGNNYYRVKQVDPDGQYSLSSVKGIHVIKTGELYVWPDPVKEVLHIRTPFVDGTIEIVDADGRILQKKPVTAFTTNVSVLQMKKGIYFVHIRYDNNKQIVERFVKE